MIRTQGLSRLLKVIIISLLFERLTEIISGIKTSKLGGVNTLIVVLKKITEKSTGGLLLILGLKEFESAQRTLAGIEVVTIIRNNQTVNSKKSYFKTSLSLVA